MKTGRNYGGVLYPDSTSYDCEFVLGTIAGYFERWAYILHDKDVDAATGELKKPHFHWVGSMNNPCGIQTIINRLGVPANSIEFLKSWKGSVKYLAHDGSPEKYQYPVEQISANFNLDRFIRPKDDVEQMRKIIDYLDDHPQIDERELTLWAMTAGCYPELKKAWYLVKQIMRAPSRKNGGFVSPDYAVSLTANCPFEDNKSDSKNERKSKK